MRIIKADCEINYDGRGSTTRGRGIRLLIMKDDGCLLIHNSVGVKPINYMTRVRKTEESDLGGGQLLLTVASSNESIDVVIFRKLFDLTFDMEADKADTIVNGTERQLQEWLARPVNWDRFLGAGSSYLCRELQTQNGSIDLVGHRGGRLIIIEVKRKAKKNDVYQVLRYKEALRKSYDDGEEDKITASIIDKATHDEHNGDPKALCFHEGFLRNPECWLIAEDAQDGTMEFCEKHVVRMALVGPDWRGETEAAELASKTAVVREKKGNGLLSMI